MIWLIRSYKYQDYQIWLFDWVAMNQSKCSSLIFYDTGWFVGIAIMEDYHLVGGVPTPLKNHGVKVSWDDDIPN